MTRLSLACAAGLALAAQACAPPPPASPVVTVGPTPAEPPPQASKVPPVEEEPPPFQPKAPFTIVAEAAPDRDFAVFPLEGGMAIVAAAAAKDMARTLSLSLVDRDEIRPAPELAAGLPAAVFTDKSLPLVAGRWPDELWLARGDKACEAHRWIAARRTWEPRNARVAPQGRCTHLAAWTPGAAIAATEGPKGPSLTAFGDAGRLLPVLPPSRADQPRSCSELLAAVQSLFGFASGEVIALGPACGVQQAWLMRWARGAAKPEVINADVDPNVPYLARAPSKDEVVIHGAGILSGNEETSVEARFQVKSGHLRRAALTQHEVNDLERWMIGGRELAGAPDPETRDGFRYQGYFLTPTDEVFVTGKLARRGRVVSSLLLRTRPVRKPITLP